MTSDTTFALLIAVLGLGWCAYVAYRAPRAWRTARSGQMKATVRLAAVTVAWLAVTAILPWPPAIAGNASAMAAPDRWCGTLMSLRVDVVIVLLLFLVVSACMVLVGARARKIERELLA
ncbi:hypothetical protein B5P44_01155 [Mycobacterium sp. CBMA 213]|uniref:Uncharacterized protein n=1 Tax=Mycolicibacterium sp. CBMA 213 TaxID=1968788 RepID=A0A343VRM4_9MYCO|nr:MULTISPECIES: hypothetical protein [unclassified Mycolicibacterium]AVN58548.1 hypothetical protein B5P44_p00253 [Mycolicibacterium sp. CBMA 213]MUL61190.1 hypothetical protein [Mycolicibacterium sp. CBMA 335]MUM03428.1 hypothetical protein [Mycolicibacterium sp. CBMA 213]